MNPEEMAALWRALRGGKLSEYALDGTTLRFKILHPELARVHNESFNSFFCALFSCTRFELQPFRNESTIISDLPTLLRLDLQVTGADTDAPGVVVLCSGQMGIRAASLRIRATGFSVWDEAFDPVSANGIEMMRRISQPDAAD